MPSIWMDVDTALPEVPVNILALIDSNDFVTREASVTFDQAGLVLIWNFVTTAGLYSQVAVTPTNTGGDYDWVNQGNGMYTIEIPLSGGGTINNDEEGFGWFTGIADGILSWVGPTIGFRDAAINNALIDGGTTWTALNNQYDGVTGLDGASYPARQDQVNSIGSGATGGTHVEATYDNTTRDTIDNAAAVDKGSGLVGIPVTGHTFTAGREVTIAGTVNYNGAFEIISQTTNEVVITDTFVGETFGGSETIVSSIKGEIFVGTITSGTFADTSAQQGDLHSMDDDGDNINIVYGFNVGGSRQATVIAIFANVNGNTDEIVVKAYNFVSDAYEAKGTIEGSGGTAFVPLDRDLIARNTGTGTEIGDVFILFDTVTTTPSSLDVDLCLITAVGTNVLIGYPNGFEISAAGTSGTEFGVNGTAGNACPFADALTMNTSNPLNLFTIHNGETVTLSGNSDNLSLIGEAWTLDLSGESIANMHVRGAKVSGTSTGSGSDFHDCAIGTVTIGPCDIIDCRFTSKTSGGFTMQTAGDYTFHGCASMVAGNDSPIFTFPGAGNTFISDRAGSGGRQYEGMSAGDLASIEGWGQFIEGTCSGGAVTIRGCMTESGNTNITLTDEARFDVTQITGGAYALDTDANGRMRIVDGTNAGELNTASGKVSITDGAIANATFAADVGSTAFATNIIALAANKAMIENRLDHLLLTDAGVNVGVDLASLVSQGTLFAHMLALSTAAGPAVIGDYRADTDSLEAIRDRGDSAWITATSVTVSDKTGFSLANGSIVAATFADNAIAAAKIATGAFTADAFAADALVAATFATGAFTADAFAADALVAATFATGAFTADAFAANALIAATFAADALSGALEDAGLVLQTTTITGLSSQTEFNLTSGPTDDDSFIGCIAVIEDASTATQKAVGIVLKYTGSTKTVFLVNNPGIFTMANGDKIRILPRPKGWVSFGTIVYGTVGSTSLTTTTMSTDLGTAEPTNDHYNGAVCIWTSGVLKNQRTDATDYVGVNGVLTYTAVTEAPSAGDTFVLL